MPHYGVGSLSYFNCAEFEALPIRASEQHVTLMRWQASEELHRILAFFLGKSVSIVQMPENPAIIVAFDRVMQEIDKMIGALRLEELTASRDCCAEPVETDEMERANERVQRQYQLFLAVLEKIPL